VKRHCAARAPSRAELISDALAPRLVDDVIRLVQSFARQQELFVFSTLDPDECNYLKAIVVHRFDPSLDVWREDVELPLEEQRSDSFDDVYRRTVELLAVPSTSPLRSDMVLHIELTNPGAQLLSEDEEEREAEGKYTAPFTDWRPWQAFRPATRPESQGSWRNVRMPRQLCRLTQGVRRDNQVFVFAMRGSDLFVLVDNATLYRCGPLLAANQPKLSRVAQLDHSPARGANSDSMVCLKGKMIILFEHAVVTWDPSTGDWGSLKSPPGYRRSRFCVQDDVLYQFYLPQEVPPARAAPDNEPGPVAARYDEETSDWVRLATMHPGVPSDGHWIVGAAAVDGQIYVLCDVIDRHGDDRELDDAPTLLARYDPKSDLWHAVPCKHFPRPGVLVEPWSVAGLAS
jgi:hypothetical protein